MLGYQVESPSKQRKPNGCPWGYQIQLNCELLTITSIKNFYPMGIDMTLVYQVLLCPFAASGCFILAAEARAMNKDVRFSRSVIDRCVANN